MNALNRLHFLICFLAGSLSINAFAFSREEMKCQSIFGDSANDPLAVTYTVQEAKKALVELVDEASYAFTARTYAELERLAEAHDEFREAAQTNPEITRLEAIALWFYTVDAYRYLNQPLRLGAALQPRVAIFGSLVRSALRKCPRFVGTVIRFQRLDKETARKLEKGRQIQFRSFLSTSARKDFKPQSLQHLHAEEKIYTLKIKAKHRAHSISAISEVSLEREVLFDAGTTFRVVEKTGSTITLEEVDHDPSKKTIYDTSTSGTALTTDGIDKKKSAGGML